MKNRLLVLNVEVSGMNKYLFSHLKNSGWELLVINVPYPRICRYVAIAQSFAPSIREWKRRFNARLDKLHKTVWTFRWRTRFCERALRKYIGNYDYILQISGGFAPSRDLTKLKFPYAMLISYTMALAKSYEGWQAFASQLGKWIYLEKITFLNARVLFTTNENCRQSLIRDYGISPEKVITVGYGLTFDQLPVFEKNFDGKTVLFIGFDFERKGGFILLDAFKKIKQSIPDARLVIIGPNPDIYPIAQEGVEFLGCIRDRKRLEEYYKDASVFALPSLCEPFGLVFLEAMAYKLACVGTKIDAMPEIIKEGETGFLVQSRDVDALAECIIRLLHDPVLLKRIGEESHKRLKEKFNWGQVTKRIDAALRKNIKE